jgi:long-chain acyl-CoA synthetase
MFWERARSDATWTAVVDVDGTPVTAGDLLVSADRLVHGFRGLGLGEGDCVAAVLPNCGEFVALYLATMRPGSISLR